MREETLAEKILIGLVFVGAIVLLMLAPDLLPFNPLCK